MGYILAIFKGSDGSKITNYEKQFLSAAVFMGMLIGGLFLGRLSDRIGRRPTLLWAMILNGGSGALSALSPTSSLLIFFRIVAGIGIGGTLPSVFTLITEFSPKSKRGLFISAVSTFWMVGSIGTAGVAWAMLGDFNTNPDVSWRPFTFVCSIPALLCSVLTFFFIPESPRFLVSKGRTLEAVAVLQQIATMNNREPISIQSEDLRASVNDDNKNTQAPVSELFSPSIVGTTVRLVTIWVTLCFGSYGIGTWITILFTQVKLDDPYQNAFFYALANLPGNLFTIALMDRLGRKYMLAGSMVLSAASALLFALSTSKAAIVTAAFLFSMFTTPAWNALNALSSESFPTTLRTSGMGFLAACGRIGSIIAMFVNGSLVETPAVLLAVTSTMMLIGTGAAFTLKSDTANVNLAESMMHY